MDVSEIGTMGKELTNFLGEFDDCFGRSEPRQHLRTYVGGQLSNLLRKSIEPMALEAGTPPRTLQRFLASVQWDEDRMVDRIQWMVARDHPHRQAIGVVDETGTPKKGTHTACVQRQWCGNTGKIDNCVVSVHIAYTAGDFHCLLDSDLYLPQAWADNPVRRKAAGIPEQAVYRKKVTMALEQIGRALRNGIRVAAWTFDEAYGRDRAFLDGLDALGQSYIGEVPSTFMGWSHRPQILHTPQPEEAHKRGPKRRYPRLARKALPAGAVRNLATYSPAFYKQKWKRFKIKSGEKGPVVWEVKHAPFFRKHGPSGLPGPTHTLLVARNVLDHDEVKYFVSNMVPGANGVSLRWMLWVAFSRWSVERCFEVAKRAMGMAHSETRSWPAIHRHFYISQLSLLFCSRIHQRLREKNDRQSVPDRRASSPSRRHLDLHTGFAAIGANETLPGNGRTHCLLPGTQSGCSHLPYKNKAPTTPRHGHQRRAVGVMHTR